MHPESARLGTIDSERFECSAVSPHMSSSTPLSAPRRIVTAHAPLPEHLRGKSNAEPAVVIHSDGVLEQIPELNGLAQHSYVWMHHALPSFNVDPLLDDPADQGERINREGLPRPVSRRDGAWSDV
jgi:hypothetical protein